MRSRAPEVSEALARQVVGLVQQLRARDDLLKPPGVAETLDWARALHRPRHRRARPGLGRRDPGCAAEVPRGRRPGEGRARPDAGADDAPRSATVHAADEVLLGFTRALRAAGVAVTAGPGATASCAAVAAVGADDRQATYWAGRATLCALARRPRPLRPGLRRLVRRARRPAAGPAARGRRARRPRHLAARRPSARRGRRDERGRGRGARRAPAAGGAAAPRRRPLDAAREATAGRDVRPAVAAPADAVVRPRHRGGTAARSTPPARCATRCATWASPARSRGADAARDRAASCCWST